MVLIVITWGLMKSTEKSFSCGICMCWVRIYLSQHQCFIIQPNTGTREYKNTLLLNVWLSWGSNIMSDPLWAPSQTKKMRPFSWIVFLENFQINNFYFNFFSTTGNSAVTSRKPLFGEAGNFLKKKNTLRVFLISECGTTVFKLHLTGLYLLAVHLI